LEQQLAKIEPEGGDYSLNLQDQATDLIDTPVLLEAFLNPGLASNP